MQKVFKTRLSSSSSEKHYYEMSIGCQLKAANKSQECSCWWEKLHNLSPRSPKPNQGRGTTGLSCSTLFPLATFMGISSTKHKRSQAVLRHSQPDFCPLGFEHCDTHAPTYNFIFEELLCWYNHCSLTGKAAKSDLILELIAYYFPTWHPGEVYVFLSELIQYRYSFQRFFRVLQEKYCITEHWLKVKKIEGRP